MFAITVTTQILLAALMSVNLKACKRRLHVFWIYGRNLLMSHIELMNGGE